MEKKMNMFLPAISGNVELRPGSSKEKIPHHARQEFWGNFYEIFNSRFEVNKPLDFGIENIDPFFGFFGLRLHPIEMKAGYFHNGIDIHSDIGTEIKPMYHGHLEYSGKSMGNGKYIMIIHPEIQTADGYVLYSLYMHCASVNVSFSLFQKINRRFFSQGKPSSVKIGRDQIIATLGGTGYEQLIVPHLHLQLWFVKNKDTENAICIDPLRTLGFEQHTNLTANLKTNYELLEECYDNNRDKTSFWEKWIDENHKKRP